MRDVIIEGTNKTPTIILKQSEGLIEIEGKSIPEDVVAFYQPIFNWLTEYVSNPQTHTIVNIRLIYFNTASAKKFQQLFVLVGQLNSGTKTLDINWHYEHDDIDMEEVGEDYQKLSGIKFNMIGVDEI